MIHEIRGRFIIDNDGKISLRHTGRLLRLGIGRAHARTEIICLVHNKNATIIALNTAELIAEFTLNPEKNYQRKKRLNPQTRGSVVHDVTCRDCALNGVSGLMR